MGFFKDFAQGALQGAAAIAARDLDTENQILVDQARIAAQYNSEKELQELKAKRDKELLDEQLKAAVAAREASLGIGSRLPKMAEEVQAATAMSGTASLKSPRVQATAAEINTPIVDMTPDEPTSIQISDVPPPSTETIAGMDRAAYEALSPQAKSLVLEQLAEQRKQEEADARVLSRQKTMADYRASKGRDSVATQKFEQGQDIMSKLKTAGAEFNSIYGVAPEEFDLYESPTVLRQARSEAVKEIDPATLASVNSQIATADQMISIYKQGAKTGELSDLFVATTGTISQPLQDFFSPEKAALRRTASEKALAIASALKPMSNTDLAYAQNLALNPAVDTETNIKATLVDKAVAERTQEYLMAKKAFIQNSVPHKLDAFEKAFSEYKENFPLFDIVKDPKGNEVPAAIVSDNYVPSFRQYQEMKSQNPDLSASQLKQGWLTLTEDERKEY